MSMRVIFELLLLITSPIRVRLEILDSFLRHDLRISLSELNQQFDSYGTIERQE